MNGLVNQQGAHAGLRELALFAGAGGGILGGKLLGWRTVCAVEYEPYPGCVLVARHCLAQMMSDALKPCPFCGSAQDRAQLEEGKFDGWVECPGCGACSPPGVGWEIPGTYKHQAIVDNCVSKWNTRHDPLALDFSPECTDGMASVEDSRNRRAWKALRSLVRSMMYGDVPQYARGPWCAARELLREVDDPDDGAEAKRPKTLTITRGGS